MFIKFFSFQFDKLHQSVAGKNLADGIGLGVFDVNPTDLSSSVWVPLNKWPAGYSLLVAVFYKITGNLIASTVLIDFFFVITFILLFRFLLRQLSFPLRHVNLLTLFQGFLISAYLEGPTDLHAATFLLASTVLSIRFFSKSSIKPTFAIWIGLAAFAAVFLRYMYAPCVIGFGVVLWLSGKLQKDTRLQKGALICFTTAAVLTISLFVVNATFTGAASYVMPMQKGFFPENLLRTFPFFYASFLNLDFVLTQLWLRTGIAYESWYTVLTYLNILTAILIAAVAFVRTKRRIQTNITPWRFFVFVSAVTFILFMIVLLYLSLTNGPRKVLDHTDDWTFLNDGRYFVWTSIVLPVIATYYLFVRKPRFRFKALARNLLLLFFVVEIFHSLYFILKPSHYTEIFEHSIYPAEVNDMLIQSKNQAQSNHRALVVTGSSDNAALWANLNKANGLFNSQILLSDTLHSRQPITLLLVTESQYADFYRPFIQKSGANLIFDKLNYKVYQYDLHAK